eukprot:TRINITY_DN18522_c0_g1_i1.p1 TRINITY_DN18522_c0_g1~~TRINITY_DN18522_c0_g1_i1.p1  ORF type:complete len:588 (+),score=61.77 TRINITY_DN18522_c0_g1_i1:65-1765(+)
MGQNGCDGSATLHQAQQQTLRSFLEKVQKCDVGKVVRASEHLAHQDDDLMEQSFRSMPYMEWSQIQALIDRSLQGVDNVLFPGKVQHYSVSGGTTARPRYIPTSVAFIGSVISGVRARAKWLKDEFNEEDPRPSGVSLHWVYFDDMDGVPAAGNASVNGFKETYMRNRAKPDVLPDEFYQLQEPSLNFIQLLRGLVSDVHWIGAPFFGHIQEILKLLCDSDFMSGVIECIRTGCLPCAESKGPLQRFSPTDEVFGYLAKLDWSPDPERADQIKHELSLGREGIFKRLWPNLSCFECMCSGSYLREIAPFMEFVGNGVKIGNKLTAGGEGIHGLGAYPICSGDAAGFEYWHWGAMITPPHMAYHEFLDLETQDVKRMHELEVGRQYELIVTNADKGLWRYRIGDVIEVKEKRAAAPVWVLIGRTRMIRIGVDDFWLSEQFLLNAMYSARDEVHIGTLEYFTFAKALTENQLVLYMQHLDHCDAQAFANALEQQLRQSKLYQPSLPVNVSFVEGEGFQKFKEGSALRWDSRVRCQTKVPALTTDTALVEILEQNTAFSVSAVCTESSR